MKKLGFGLMRLPRNEQGIDIQRSAAMADEFLRRGYNYFDTAYVYEGSEDAFRQAVIQRHPRESFIVADKLPVWPLKSKADCEKVFNTSLERLGIDYFDYYLLHSITDEKVAKFEEYDAWNFCLQKKKEGKIRHFGFSFHGTPATLEKLLTLHPEAEFVQLQINYIDWNHGVIASRQMYEIARRFKKPIIIMEPVKGGTLANLPEQAENELKSVYNGSAASFALRFAATLPGVFMVLSGMSDEAQMEDNLNTFDSLSPLSHAQTDALEKIRTILLDSPVLACTACRYCTDGCPMELPIPVFFKAYNKELLARNGKGKEAYAKLLSDHSGADQCIACGKCEEVCPQHLPIIKTMRSVHAALKE